MAESALVCPKINPKINEGDLYIGRLGGGEENLEQVAIRILQLDLARPARGRLVDTDLQRRKGARNEIQAMAARAKWLRPPRQARADSLDQLKDARH